MGSPYRLSWLPPAPDEFGPQVRAAQSPGDLSALAAYDLNFTQLDKLGRRLARLRPEEAHGRITLGLLGSGTLDFLAPAIEATGLRHRLDLKVVTGRYGQPMQDALDPDSGFLRAQPEMVVLSLDHRTLPFPQPSGTDAGDSLAPARTQLATIVEALKKHGVKVVVLQTVPLLPESLFGHFDRQTDLAINRRLRRWNDELVERCAADDALVLLDADDLASRVGRLAWYNEVQWQLAKLPFDQQLVPLYADHVARLIGALRGRSRKALVLDLDNTLWGGVIGDDGLDGIRLGAGSTEGEAFVAVQRMALSLKDRGIVLAVCSKNEEAAAWGPFDKHSEMVLKRDDIAVFVANWDTKSDNLREIARRLNLGLDALVFLDDNPVERAQVRAALPDVAVPELPADPAGYPAALWQAGYFEAINVSGEDLQRAEQYRANSQRESLQAESADIGAFLRTLDMRAILAPFRDSDMVRITQLLNKTNQFNLTTRRYTQPELVAIAADPANFTLQVRLLDCFGDNGIISLVICRQRAEQCWRIDTWLMSCRVFKREVERMVLNQLVQAARQNGITTLEGEYRPTEKNVIVANHYRDCGFVPVDGEDGLWRLDLTDYQPVDPPISVSWSEVPEEVS